MPVFTIEHASAHKSSRGLEVSTVDTARHNHAPPLRLHKHGRSSSYHGHLSYVMLYSYRFENSNKTSDYVTLVCTLVVVEVSV